MTNRNYFAVVLWFCVFASMPFSYAQTDTENAEGVPAGLSGSDYQRLSARKESLDSARISLEAAKEEFNSECEYVSSEDRQKVDTCRLRYDMLNRLMDNYDRDLEDYKSDIAKIKEQYSSTVTLFEKGVPGSPPVDLRDKDVEGAVLLDYQTRKIDPGFLEKVIASFDEARLDMEVVQNDPRMMTLTRRLMDLESKKAELDRWIPLRYQEVKAEIRKRNPGLSEEDLAWEVFWDQRVKKVAEHARGFDRAWKKEKEVLDREFDDMLKIAKGEYARKKAEDVIRERWRKGLDAGFNY